MSSSEKNEENTYESSNCDEKEDNNISNAEFNRSEELLETDFEILPQDIGEPDNVYKIIIIGDSGVGKTCLTYRAKTGKFHES